MSLPKAQSTISRLEIVEAVLDDCLQRLRRANAIDSVIEGERLLAAVKEVKGLPSGDPRRVDVLSEAMDFQRKMRQLLLALRKH